VLVASHVIAASNPNFQANSPLGIFLALIVCGSTVLAMTGMGLAVGGLCQKRRKNIFAVLGLILNGLVLMCVMFWMMVGMLTA
jgi:hypothetical protein